MRFLTWVGTWALASTAGCWLVVPFGEFTGEQPPETANVPDGGDTGDVDDASHDAADASRGPTPVRPAKGTLRGIAVTKDFVYWVEGRPAAGATDAS